jgi:hypothetical protein
MGAQLSSADSLEISKLAGLAVHILSRTRLYTATISFRYGPNGTREVLFRTDNGCSRMHLGIEAFGR